MQADGSSLIRVVLTLALGVRAAILATDVRTIGGVGAHYFQLK
ncbi:hypothetical protein HMPREF9578_00754 [Cutibacterium acnes HL110PA4]|nr:hypothetical protein HMPREF9619_01620 [Cutibacterium acnes HL082PA2]EFT63491.1 hypothetical protein HMPREF9578_00754 [Cutibacterium acnes HL110PA4]EGE70607.1 hypothetical protein HMPREF9341_00317 [Cutibacterium acnes HL103PA1]